MQRGKRRWKLPNALRTSAPLPTSSCDAMDTSIPFAPGQPPVDLYIIRMTMIVEKSMLLIFSDRIILGLGDCLLTTLYCCVIISHFKFKLLSGLSDEVQVFLYS